MKKFLILFIAVFALCSCSKDDDFLESENSSPCLIDYFMNHYYTEYYYNGKCILDKRDIKNFEIRKYESNKSYCVLLTIDYYEHNNNGYISSILNTLDNQLYNEFNSEDRFYTPEAAIQILCNHPQCLSKYYKYNTK